MWVLHSWSPWLTHSNTFLKWHSYFNTIIFIYKFKISLNHSSKKTKQNKRRKQRWGEINSWSCTIWFSTVWEKKKNNQRIHLLYGFPTEDYNCELCTIYSSNNHHNIAVNVTLNVSLEEKYTVTPTQLYSTATRKKCQRTQRDRSRSFTLKLSFAFDLHRNDLHTTESLKTQVWLQWSV